MQQVTVEDKEPIKEDEKIEKDNVEKVEQNSNDVSEEPKEDEKVSEELKKVSEEPSGQKNVIERVTSSEGIPLTEEGDDEDDGYEGDWITPDNVDEYKAIELGVTPEELRKTQQISVGCMTSDFAMQNVLLQMNLNLVSSGGYRVKKIRNSVMRCHACFT